jgi:hypothetical protein
MHPIIVLDGPDGVGKSTLAAELAMQLGAHVTHLTYRWKTKMFDYHTAGLFNCLYHAQFKPVILDRWWPSEVVYADAYRGGSRWPLAHRMFEKAALKHAITYVFCIPKNKRAYLEHFDELKGKRTELFNEGMERVYDGFCKIFARMSGEDRPGVTSYDYQTTPLGNLHIEAQSIAEAAFDLSTYQWAPALQLSFMNFTGFASRAKYLVIGDQLKPKTRREVWPFFQYGDSSLWLASTMEDLGVPESDLIFMNANHDSDGAYAFMIEKAADYKIIALGGEAEQYVRGFGLPYRRVNHPQYYRRFNSQRGKVELAQAFDRENFIAHTIA